MATQGFNFDAVLAFGSGGVVIAAAKSLKAKKAKGVKRPG